MKVKFSYLIAGLLLFFSGAIYANGITCALESSAIPSKTKIGVKYVNVYKCTDNNGPNFPVVGIKGSVAGTSNGTSLGGTCTSGYLNPMRSCEFTLNFKPTAAGQYSFHLHVTFNNQAPIDLPTVNTTTGSPPNQGKITWPGSTSGSATVDAKGDGTGQFEANATDSSGESVYYTFKLSGAGSVTAGQTPGSFTLNGVTGQNETVTVTANADDADAVAGTPISIEKQRATITWPGSTSGSATVDANGDGTGQFEANATDSSGASVSYTFKLSGAGSVTAGQTPGSFTLSGATDQNETVTVTANADDADAVSGTPISIQQKSQVPTKTISIYNNTSETIYPVIETLSPSQDNKPDRWLQAEFQVTNPEETYTHTKLYRVYVNPNNGIAPNSSITLKVPFYSKLVENPNPKLADQYVDWWNGMRLYIYDDKPALNVVYDEDKKNPVNLLSTGLSCSTGTCEPLNAYANTAGLPLNDPYQLTEYTFANIDTSNQLPYKLYMNYVDYDLSYVDHVYLPVAMEPQDNATVGYVGTVQDLTNFRDIISKFVSATGWPTFTASPAYPNQRVPGTYNVFVLGTGIAPVDSQAKQMIAGIWDNITGSQYNDKTGGTVGTLCDNSTSDACVVWKLFKANYDEYKNRCSDPQALTDKMMLQHIYGWAPFDNCTSPTFSNELYNTPGIDYQATVDAYHKLQYDYKTGFNPYVKFIHDPEYLNMSAYAFSIDDAVGNMNKQGTGIILSIGGDKGLVNKKPYNVNDIVRVNLGAPANKSDPDYTKFGICTATPNRSLEGERSFELDTIDYPCEISLEDSSGKTYHFTVSKKPPLTTSDIQCTQGDTWCSRIAVDSHTTRDIDTPPALVPNKAKA